MTNRYTYRRFSDEHVRRYGHHLYYDPYTHYVHNYARYRGPHRDHRPQRGRRTTGPAVLLLCCAAMLAGAGVLAVIMFTALVAFAPFMLAGVGTVVVLRHLHRRNHGVGREQQPAVARPRPTSPAPGPARVPDWHATRTRFAELRSAYAEFECDPLAVLRLPALADVTVASTGRFVEAFAEAQALDTDTEPPAAHCARFATAVDHAWRAWHAARDAAERIRLARIPAQEQATVERAIKLLTMARDSDHDAERITAYAKARAELAKLERSRTLRLPPAAAAALDAAARRQLPTG